MVERDSNYVRFCAGELRMGVMADEVRRKMKVIWSADD